MSSGEATVEPESSPLRSTLLDAMVLADSRDDVAQAAKILHGAVRRAAPDDPALGDARAFLDELTERLA
ncbi:hypothetical protein [Phycicoccus avicenniae]|uniref:hypothetical protein n=1 Tax=Phycicoccus avicenniae TaxID=2828860 RepID=UPI003D278F14